MAKVERFEDLRCWQLSRALVKDIYQMEIANQLSKDFDVRNQLISTAISIMNNIAEGFASFSKKEFALSLNRSQCAAAKVKSMLYICDDLNYTSAKQLNNLHDMVDQVRKATQALINYLLSTQKSYGVTSGSRIREPRETYPISTESYQISDEHVNIQS